MRILTVLGRLHGHRVRRLSLDRFEERHQEEVVLGELAEVGQSVRFGLAVVHHDRHHVVRLRAARQVSEPHVDALDPFRTTRHLKNKKPRKICQSLDVSGLDRIFLNFFPCTYLPHDPHRSRRYGVQFLEVNDFGAEPLPGFVQRLLRDDRVRSAGLHHGGQRARHAQAVRVFRPHHEHVRRVRFQIFHLSSRNCVRKTAVA